MRSDSQVAFDRSRKASQRGLTGHPSLRREEAFEIFAQVLRDVARRSSFRVVHFNVMTNHIHIVASFSPKKVRKWSDEEVAERSLKLMPTATFAEARAIKARLGDECTPERLAKELAKNKRWIQQQRWRPN